MYQLPNKKFKRDDLGEHKIEIGVKGYDTPLLRNALLQENFCHIYDQNFEKSNWAQIAKI